MREIRTSGLMSGDGKRGGAVAPVLAPILDSTLPRGGAPVTARGRGAVRTSAGPTGQRDRGGRHHAVDRSPFTARVDPGGGYPADARPIRNHGPIAAGRGGAAISQPVQRAECLNPHPYRTSQP